MRLTVKDLNGEAKADLITGSGLCGGSRTTAYSEATLAGATLAGLLELNVLADSSDGVFVG